MLLLFPVGMLKRRFVPDGDVVAPGGVAIQRAEKAAGRVVAPGGVALQRDAAGRLRPLVLS